MIFRAVLTCWAKQRANWGEIRDLSDVFASLSERVGDLYYTAQDLAQELKDTLDGMDLDASQLEEIEDRLDLLRNLKRKYGPTVAEVLAFGEKARAELETIEFPTSVWKSSPPGGTV